MCDIILVWDSSGANMMGMFMDPSYMILDLQGYGSSICDCVIYCLRVKLVSGTVLVDVVINFYLLFAVDSSLCLIITTGFSRALYFSHPMCGKGVYSADF